jgi:glutamate racemase
MNYDANNFIGVFDSGLGGISVLNYLISLMPYENYVYYADSNHFPYGRKSKKELVKIGKNIISRFYKRDAKTVVIACNTMSTSDMPAFSKKFPDLKIIGTYPNFAPMLTSGLVLSNQTIIYNRENRIKITRNRKKLLIIATTATCKSEYLSDLTSNADSFMSVYVEPADYIVHAVENNELESFDFKSKLRDFFKEYMDIDFLLLGCTHFSFALNSIREVLGDKVKILSSGDIAANDCYRYLSSNNLLSKNLSPYIDIVDASIDESKMEVYKRLINLPNNTHEVSFSKTFKKVR